MAKTEQITLQDIIKSQEANKTGGMSAFVLKQLSELQKTEKQPANVEESTNNIAKLTAAVEKNSKILSNPIKKNDITEADIENKKIQDEQTALLSRIAENTTPRPGVTAASNLPDFGGLGAIVAGVAIAIGTFIGVIRAQVKAIKLFSEALKVDKLIGAVKGGLLKVGEFFGGLVNIAKDKIGKSLFDPIEEVFKTVSNKLKGIKDGVMKFIMPFVNTFTDAFKIIGEMLAGPVGKAVDGIKGIFSSIGQYFSTFAKSIGKVAGIVGKLFLPITIIMSLWDTVKGSMEGFAEEGIIGGIKGAITGLVNSLIMGPLDMIKNAIAWILGVFGFDEAKDLLMSFGLEDIFKKFVDAIFSPINMIKDMFNLIVNFFKGIEIPAIGFEVFGKKFGAGPWHPFAGEGKGSTAPAANASPPAPKAPMTAIKPLPAFVASTDAAGNPVVSNSSIVTPAPNTANNVYKQSGTNVASKTTIKPATSAPVVVSAPVTNNKTNQQGFFKSPIRNTENSLNQFYKSRYVA
jgi:hypothetical protein